MKHPLNHPSFRQTPRPRGARGTSSSSSSSSSLSFSLLSYRLVVVFAGPNCARYPRPRRKTSVSFLFETTSGLRNCLFLALHLVHLSERTALPFFPSTETRPRLGISPVATLRSLSRVFLRPMDALRGFGTGNVVRNCTRCVCRAFAHDSEEMVRVWVEQETARLSE
jgi:hypothetical protein